MGARVFAIGQLLLVALCASGGLQLIATPTARAAPDGAYRRADRDASSQPAEPSAEDEPSSVDSDSAPDGASQLHFVIGSGAALLAVVLVGAASMRRKNRTGAPVEQPSSPGGEGPGAPVVPASGPAAEANDAGPIGDTAPDYSPGLRLHQSTTASPHVAVEFGGTQVEIRIGAATVFLQRAEGGVGSSMVETDDSFARVSLDEERWVVRVRALAGSDPTVDGVPLPIDGQVGFGTSVRVAPDVLLEPREGVAGPSPRWRVRASDPLPGVPDQFDVTEHAAIIGREPSAQADEVRVRVPGQFADGRRNGVSASHLVVWVANGDLFIRDERSSFGTFVNEERLVPGLAYRLEPRDAIVLAEGAVRFVVSGPILTRA